MKKRLIVFTLLLTLLSMVAVAWRYRAPIKMLIHTHTYDKLLPAEKIKAVISFSPNQVGASLITLDHYQINLSTGLDDTSGLDIMAMKDPNNEPLMITVNTWGGDLWKPYFNSPVEAIISGKYDRSLKTLFNYYRNMGSRVYFRLNPEMEVPGWRFPWQMGGHDYLGSFQHVAKLCRMYAPEAQVVWGPAGYPGSMEFYPGDDFVDASTVSLKSLSEQRLQIFPKDYPVSYDLFRRVHRLRFTYKSIFVLLSDLVPDQAVDAEMVASLDSLLKANTDVAYRPGLAKNPGSLGANSHRDTLLIGFYDPKELHLDDPAVSVEHLFVDFGNLADGSFESRFEKALGRKHQLIVTFEPFRHPEKGRDEAVLENISAGVYDKELSRFYSILQSTNTTIYLRYAHEMEIPIDRYPWQSKDPLVYIASFRYFMGFLNPLPNNIKRVWGPTGDRGCTEWWPGEDVVDLISIAIYGLPDKNITDHKMQEGFNTIFQRKTRRMRFFDKPIFITEFGIKGPEEYQTKWLEEAAVTIRNNPQVIGVNYFNMSDTPKAWGDIKPPDWTISRSTFHNFLAELSKK